MKKILLHSLDSSFEKIFNPGMRDNFNDPFIHLKKRLYLLGYELVAKSNDLSNINEYKWIILIDSPFISENCNIFKKIIKSIAEKNKINKINANTKKIIKNKKNNFSLFLWEGKSVRPSNYKKDLYEMFNTIFTWDDNQVDNKKFYKFYHPIPDNLPEVTHIPFSQKKLLINISRNRRSNFSKELYSEREKTISYFNKYFPNNFDLYGVDWNKPINRIEKIFPFLVKKYNCYQGAIKNKSEVIPYYKFSLCYENIFGEQGLITEKIFDTMRLSSVPIYWGSSNIEEYVDKNAFIDRRNFKSNKELADYIINMKENEYNKYLETIKLYLKSEKFSLFLPENFTNTIIKILKL